MRGAGFLGRAPVERKKPEPVERTSQGVEHAAEKLGTRPRKRGPVARSHLAPHVKARRLPERHEEHPVLPEADDFGAHAETCPRRADDAKFPKADIRALGLDHKPGHPDHSAQALHGGKMAHLRPDDFNQGGDGGVHDSSFR